MRQWLLETKCHRKGKGEGGVEKGAWRRGRGPGVPLSESQEIIADDHSVASLPTLGLGGNPFTCGTTLFA